MKIEFYTYCGNCYYDDDCEYAIVLKASCLPGQETEIVGQVQNALDRFENKGDAEYALSLAKAIAYGNYRKDISVYCNKQNELLQYTAEIRYYNESALGSNFFSRSVNIM